MTERQELLPDSHTFDAHIVSARRWLSELMGNLALPATDAARGLHALRAGLHAIRDRLPASEVVDLGAQLPVLIRGFYYEGWTLADHAHELRDRDAVVARVKRDLAPDKRLDPLDVLRAVVQLVVEHVSAGEVDDILATLPKSIRSLWDDLTNHAFEASITPRGRRLVRHTGYSR